MHSKDPSVSTFSFRLYFRYWLLVFALPSTELCVRAVGAAGWLDRRKRRRENCAGRKDALVAAASDSISMNFTAEAAAAVAAAASSDSLSKPEAAPRVGAPTRGPPTASHLPSTLESCVWRGRENWILFSKGEEQSQVGRILLTSLRIEGLLNWTTTTLMLVQSFGYGLILLRCLLVLLFIPWAILIYFVRKEEREFSTAALGNSRPFCPPSLQSFFLAGPVLYLFIPCFPTLGCRLKGFGSSSGTRSPETRFGCPFIGFSFSASPFCTLVLHLCIFLSYCSPFKVISKKAQKGCRGSFSLRWRLGLWVEKPSEDLPKA